jgi:hypothetical protein
MHNKNRNKTPQHASPSVGKKHDTSLNSILPPEKRQHSCLLDSFSVVGNSNQSNDGRSITNFVERKNRILHFFFVTDADHQKHFGEHPLNDPERPMYHNVVIIEYMCGVESARHETFLCDQN